MTRPLVLLHGLARSRHSMWLVARAAAAHGYRATSIGYPSRRAPIATLAALVAERVLARVPDGPIDLVTHSMGGIVLRTAVAAGHLPVDRIGRVVMLAPPSRGSELSDWVRRVRLSQWAFGPALGELGTGADSVPLALPPIPFACGIVAGRRTLVPMAGRLFQGPSDGRVSVARAGAEGMQDFLVVDRAHPFLMWSPSVLDAVFGFLANGQFGKR